MVMKVEPIYKAVQSLKSKKQNAQLKTRIILFSPRGKKFNQKKAFELAAYEHIIFICGRYEGVDERVAKYVADEMLSLGDFDLMGGEIPAMAVIETVARLIPGVIGKPEFLKERVAKTEKGNAFMEYPQYTRPEAFVTVEGKTWKAPKVLLSGNHKEIADWRKKHGKMIR